MNTDIRKIVIAFSMLQLCCAHTCAVGAQSGKGTAQTQATQNFGPRKRAIVSSLDVKVQNVTTTITTPSGNASIVTLDIQQPTEFGNGLTEMLITALVESKRFTVLDRATIEEFAKERSLPDTDPGTVAKAGRLLGAQVIVKGAVTEISFKRAGAGANLVSQVIDGTIVNSIATVALDVRLVDVETGQVIDSVRAEGRVGSKLMSLTLKAEDVKLGVASFENGPLGFAVRRAVIEAVKKISERMEKVPWEARIAETTDDEDGLRLYLNAGAESGLKVGDVLEIFKAGKPIIDPDSGLVIGKTKGKRLGLCKIVTADPKIAIAAPLEGSGFQREDVVRVPLKSGG